MLSGPASAVTDRDRAVMSWPSSPVICAQDRPPATPPSNSDVAGAGNRLRTRGVDFGVVTVCACGVRKDSQSASAEIYRLKVPCAVHRNGGEVVGSSPASLQGDPAWGVDHLAAAAENTRIVVRTGTAAYDRDAAERSDGLNRRSGDAAFEHVTDQRTSSTLIAVQRLLPDIGCGSSDDAELPVVEIFCVPASVKTKAAA